MADRATYVGGGGGFVGGSAYVGSLLSGGLSAIATIGVATAVALTTQITFAATATAGVTTAAELTTAIRFSATATAGVSASADFTDFYGIQDLIEWPDRELIILAEAEPSIILSDFTATSGRTDVYEMVFPKFRETTTIVSGLYAPCFAVRENSTNLDEETSIANVESNAGSWFWDDVNEILYIHTSGGGSPDTYTLYQAFVRIYIASKSIVLNQTTGDADTGIFYHPWLTDQSQAITTQTGDGLFSVKISPTATIDLTNEEGIWFRLLAPDGVWVWKNRQIHLWVGGSVRGYQIQRPNYDQFLTMIVDDYAPTDVNATIELKQRTHDLDTMIPRTPIFETEYPNLDPDARGKHKSLIYGRATVAPALVDTTVSQGKYLVADAAYQTLFAVHNVWAVAKSNGALTLLTLTTHYTVDLTACTITVVSATYPHTTYTIRADVSGKPDGVGGVMDTAAEIVEDILRTHIGASDEDIDTTSFDDAVVDTPEVLAVVLTSPRTISSILMTSEPKQPSIERSVFATLRETATGLWQFKLRGRGDSGTVVSLGQRDFSKFTPVLSRELLFAKTAVFYDYESALDTWAVAEYTDQRSRYLLTVAEDTTEDDKAELYTYLTDSGDAEALAQRYQIMAGGSRLKIEFEERSAKLYRALVADRASVTYSPAPDVNGSFDAEELEITELRKSITPTLITSGVLRDIRGLPGGWIWAPDSVDDVWDDLSDEDKELYGGWADDDGYIVPADPTTLNIKSWI